MKKRFSLQIKEKKHIEKKEISCCFTGHRTVGEDLDVCELKSVIKRVAQQGYTRFLCGMAVGFDSLCFDVCEELKQELPQITLVACVPCENQDAYFSKSEKVAYRARLKRADEVIVLSPRYFEGCMQVRNRYMVDHSSVLITYLRKEEGGAFYTSTYGEKKMTQQILV